MPDIGVTIGVDGIAQFKQGMNEAKDAVKTLDQELKLNEQQFKATGDAEEYLSNKADILKRQIAEQKNVIEQGKSALKAMQTQGVEPTSHSFQVMQRNVLEAQGKLLQMESNLQGVSTQANSAKQSTDGMNTELKKIGKGIAWENVANGIHQITDKLQAGARAAINFGKKVTKSAMSSTEWADDVLTRAKQYGLDAEMIQRMDNVAQYIDTDTDTIIAAKTRLAKNKDKITDLLGIDTEGLSIDEAFWAAGEALVHMGEEWDKETDAQQLFGKSWKELLPLFTAGQEEYNRLIEEQHVLSNEQVESLGKADDAFKSIQQQIDLLKNEFWAKNADAITGLLQWIVDNKDGVVAALTAIAAGFGALKVAELAADIGRVVEGLGKIRDMGGNGANSGGSGGNGGSNNGELAKDGLLTTAKSVLKDALPVLATDAAVIAAAITPAVIAQEQDYIASEEKRARRVSTAGTSNSPDAQFLQAAAEALTLRRGENPDFTGIQSLLMGLQNRQNQQLAELYNTISTYAPITSNGNYTWNLLNRYWESGGGLEEADADALLEAITTAFEGKINAENAMKFPVAPELEEGASEQLQAEIGIINVPVHLIPDELDTGMPHANGIWNVPYDGYHAILHKGERVVPAREVAASRSYSSNLYVESMYMNNGQDAEGLAAAMAAAQRRTMSGFGS